MTLERRSRANHHCVAGAYHGEASELLRRRASPRRRIARALEALVREVDRSGRALPFVGRCAGVPWMGLGHTVGFRLAD